MHAPSQAPRSGSNAGLFPHVIVSLLGEVYAIAHVESPRAQLVVAHAHIFDRRIGEPRGEHFVELAHPRIPGLGGAGRAEPNELELLALGGHDDGSMYLSSPLMLPSASFEPSTTKAVDCAGARLTCSTARGPRMCTLTRASPLRPEACAIDSPWLSPMTTAGGAVAAAGCWARVCEAMRQKIGAIAAVSLFICNIRGINSTV